MIGKSLRERFGVRTPLEPSRSVEIVESLVDAQAAHLIAVRSNDDAMVACLFVDASEASVRLCQKFGFEMRRGGTGVLGVPGAELARQFPELPPHQRKWLEASQGPRETKVLLLAGDGLGLVSVEAHGADLRVTAVAYASA
ncbi:MAG: hypothetical protein IPG50_29390 [Myxococcales bacterium]|nr:hypothetical protein [Myxococcales bacterium]